jgi:uncharacterized protein (UPF0264 family)
MMKLLVSVRSLDEARVAWNAGVDMVDLKEPARGPLGAVDSNVATEVASSAGGRGPLSMALGELMDECSDTARIVPEAVSYAKLGMAGALARGDWPQRWEAALTILPATTSAVAVIYADWREAQAPRPSAVLEQGRRLACGAMLVDTWQKSGRCLMDYIDPAELAELIADARAAGMLTVVGGSLTCDNLSTMAQFSPDYVAVRGAVCRGSRLGALDGEKVRQWAEHVHRQ